MAGRAFCVKVQLDVHAVTCPGVWLCSNGKVALQINALDSYAESRRISPIFPLLFHDKFTFSKIFTRVISLAELQCTLEQEFLYAKLIQWVTPASRGIILATFETNLADLLYPAPCFKGLLAGVDIDLLMESTKCFPGIIAPKIEISTKTIVEEVLCSYDKYVINPKMINSKQTACVQRKRPIKGIIRQRRVCHTKTKPRSQSCQPYRQRSNDCQCSATRYATSHRTGSQIDQSSYHSIRRDSACTCQANFTKSAEPTLIRNNIHVIDNCPVCFKYNFYFPKYHDDSDIAKKYIDAKQRCHRNLSDVGECDCICRNGASDIQKEAAMSLSQSDKIEKLPKTREKWHVTETDNVPMCRYECDPKCKYTRDYSGHGFYKNLEKFYKRMYRQAKMRAQEVDG